MTFPLPTLAATVTSAGITAPTFADILTSLQASLRIIYGQDLYLDPDTQDGQMLGIFAQGMSDGNSATIAAYNSFSPATAQGAGLSSIVKINGISRAVSSSSSVDLLIGGSVGTIITNGVAGDANGNSWALPVSVTIPPAGAILVTATCTAPGQIDAVPYSVTIINTPTLGWSTVSNPSAAAPGAPVETDAQLRIRQGQSVALPALTALEATLAAVKALPGIIEAVIYENDTGTPDTNGLPAHSIAVVVSGGDAMMIATAINDKKTPGTYTYGTTSVFVTDTAGVTHQIRFFVPTNVPVQVLVQIRALQGYSGTTGIALRQAIVDYINGTNIGQSIDISRLYLPAQLYGGPGTSQYELQQLFINVPGNPPAGYDIAIAFNGQATCTLADVTLVVS